MGRRKSFLEKAVGLLAQEAVQATCTYRRSEENFLKSRWCFTIPRFLKTGVQGDVRQSEDADKAVEKAVHDFG